MNETYLSSTLQEIFDNAPCGFIISDAAGGVVDANNTILKWLGYSRDEVVHSLSVEGIIGPDGLGDFRMAYSKLMENGALDEFRTEIRARNGEEIPVVISAAVIRDSDGSFSHTRISILDDTARRDAELRLENLNKELEDFTYSVSHDLRAPLRSIDGYARILNEDYESKLDPEGQKLINIIVTNAKRMGTLIDDLLDFSRLGRKEMQWSSVDMDAMARSVVAELCSREKERNIRVVVHPLARAYGDVDMIRRVWINLISNAIKFTARTAEAVIEISSRSGDEGVSYSVRDNGVGFEMRYSGKLFGIFQRLHKVQEFPGTGVGLAIVKRIITRHNGMVGAEGEAGKGATFHFMIPKYNGK